SQYEAQRFTQQGIYPDIWDEPEEDLREEYIDYFESLKAFVSTAAQSGHSLQISLV
ncbi:MAG: DUF1877 family protein, partial [Planctomycetales bacterium]|nr:DUF1877 family protein [Planctomycetales bacterium]